MDILFTPNSANPPGTEKSLTFDRTSEPLSYGITELCSRLGISKLDACIIPVDWSKKYKSDEILSGRNLTPKSAAKLIDDNFEEAYVVLVPSAPTKISTDRMKKIWEKENPRALLKSASYVIWTMHDWIALRVEVADNDELSTKNLAKDLAASLNKAQIAWEDEG